MLPFHILRPPRLAPFARHLTTTPAPFSSSKYTNPGSFANVRTKKYLRLVDAAAKKVDGLEVEEVFMTWILTSRFATTSFNKISMIYTLTYMHSGRLHPRAAMLRVGSLPRVLRGPEKAGRKGGYTGERSPWTSGIPDHNVN